MATYNKCLHQVFFGVIIEMYIADMDMTLVQPNGTIISNTYAFEDNDAGHVGYRIPNPIEGEWKLLVKLGKAEVRPVDYQVMVTAKTNVSARLILPSLLRRFMTGNRIPIYALVTSRFGPLSGASVLAGVTAPNGMTQTVPLLHRGGGMYLGYYTLGNQADPVSPPPEDGHPDPNPNDEGSYRVDLLVDGQGGLHRETQGAFSILEADDENSNGLPDTWEEEHGVTDPSDDPDLDLLTNSDEYYAGTDPNNSDSDGGGEHDGSEVTIHSQDPLDPADDQIEAPDFFHATPVVGGDVVLTYDVKAEYTKMSLTGATWQAFAQGVPWTLDASFGDLAQVYVLFKDASSNESVGPAIGAILFVARQKVYLPLVLRDFP